jgi:hypothetical protein
VVDQTIDADENPPTVSNDKKMKTDEEGIIIVVTRNGQLPKLYCIGDCPQLAASKTRKRLTGLRHSLKVNFLEAREENCLFRYISQKKKCFVETDVGSFSCH